jgi:hypothetical protein
MQCTNLSRALERETTPEVRITYRGELSRKGNIGVEPIMRRARGILDSG